MDSPIRGGHGDWATLSAGTTLRLVTPATYLATGGLADIWREIFCWADQDGEIKVLPPTGFDPSLPLKIFTHGFSSSVRGHTAFVSAWMEAEVMPGSSKPNVVLFDWSGLASPFQASWEDYVYNEAARNAIDVGEWLGMCMAALANDTGLAPGGLHLVGHSLGAHLMGKAARVLHEGTGQRVGRISGLDPAGPRFVDGLFMSAIPELAQNILSRDDASFVDIIHTNGDWHPAGICATCVIPGQSRYGLLRPLGHLDFYPAGGSSQPGCPFWSRSRCSHSRAIQYFLDSINEPHLFPAQACDTPELCNQEVVSGTGVVGFMGEAALQGYTGNDGLRYLAIQN